MTKETVTTTPEMKMEGIKLEGKLYCLETDVRKHINDLLAMNASLKAKNDALQNIIWEYAEGVRQP